MVGWLVGGWLRKTSIVGRSAGALSSSNPFKSTRHDGWPTLLNQQLLDFGDTQIQHIHIHLETDSTHRITHENLESLIQTENHTSKEIRQAKSMQCVLMITTKIMLIIFLIGRSQPISRPIVNRISISEADLGEL